MDAVKAHATLLLTTEGGRADLFGAALVALSTAFLRILDQTVMPLHLTQPGTSLLERRQVVWPFV